MYAEAVTTVPNKDETQETNSMTQVLVGLRNTCRHSWF